MEKIIIFSSVFISENRKKKSKGKQNREKKTKQGEELKQINFFRSNQYGK